MKSIDLLKAIACDVGDEAILRQICNINTSRRASRLLLQFHTEFVATLAEAAVEDVYPCTLWELAWEAAIDAAKLRSPRSWSIITSDMRQGVLMAGVIADVCLAHREGHRPILKKGPATKINAFSLSASEFKFHLSKTLKTDFGGGGTALSDKFRMAGAVTAPNGEEQRSHRSCEGHVDRGKPRPSLRPRRVVRERGD